MTTPQQRRRDKLAADYNEMLAIRGNIIQWEPLHGKEPHCDSYRLKVNVRTIVGPGPNYATQTLLQVDLPPGYPYTSPPLIVALSRPFPFHPNWFPSGQWCYGTWAPVEGLGQYVIRAVRILQFDPTITNLGSPANAEALKWWHEVSRWGWFPSDRSVLPDPTAKPKPKIKIKEVPGRKINIRPVN
jgi:ubiquitin-protein ligase